MDKITRFEGQHRFLSNFYLCSIVINDVVWASAEHAFQAAKCADQEEYTYFVNIVNKMMMPAGAKTEGKKVKLRSDWEVSKNGIMYQIVKEKFKQNERLRNMLWETGDDHLEEGNWWRDTYWGTCAGRGENHLGKILMRVRGELK